MPVKLRHAPDAPFRLGTRVRAWLVSVLSASALVATTTDSFALEPPANPGKAKIAAGAGMMFAGGAAVLLGGVLYYANENSGKSTCAPCQESSWVLPAVLWSIGGATFIAGGVVFGVGQVEQSRAAPPTVTLSVSPFGASARLTF
jgi:hypothetical protein